MLQQVEVGPGRQVQVRPPLGDKLGKELGPHREVDQQVLEGKVPLQQVGMEHLQVQVDRQVRLPRPAKLGTQVESAE